MNKKLTSINPTNLEIVKSYNIHNESEVYNIILSASKIQSEWMNNDIDFRLTCLEKVSSLLNDNCNYYAKLMALEMGKPIKQGISEIEKCIFLCEYYQNQSKNILLKKDIKTENYKSYILYEPLGLILGIMPWNFPFWQVFRFAIPSLVTGNGVILKHASNVQGCADAIEEIFLKSGCPQNLFRNLIIPGSRVKSVIENNHISAVTLTGSTPVGKSVASIASNNLKKTVMELGGNDPYIILDDANLNQAANACVSGRLINGGQSCIAAKRIIITKKNHSQFIKILKEKLLTKVMGDPIDEVDLGPMVSIEARDIIHSQVLKSIDDGAKLILGGELIDDKGAFYPITLLDNVLPGMTAFDEEIFGPVFSIIIANDEQNAIDLANNTEFGLGASVFTADIEKGEFIASKKLFAGSCFVNDFVRSDPRLPFGGIKNSGYGRELSYYGLMEFVNIKTIVVNNIE
tara:strand:+ start:509 stop:1888 length:1380 start_codon:yes stop_codon:yes gene_type:complete